MKYIFDQSIITITIYYYNKLSESQSSFRFGHSCVDNLSVLNEVVQGRLQEGKKTFSFFLDNKKAQYCEANVTKCAVVVFRNERTFDGE